MGKFAFDTIRESLAQPVERLGDGVEALADAPGDVLDRFAALVAERKKTAGFLRQGGDTLVEGLLPALPEIGGFIRLGEGLIDAGEEYETKITFI